MSVKILTEHLKNGNFGSLYYIFGDEAYLKEHYYSELRCKTVSDLAEFNVIEFDSKNFDYIDFCNCVNSYPVMADRKFVGVVDFDNSMLKKDFTKEFISFLKGIPDFCTVVFYDTDLKMLSGVNQLEKAVASAGGITVNAEHPSNASLVSWCTRHFKKAGQAISSDDINYMLSMTDSDMRSLVNEISKLCSFVSGDTITRADIDAVVTKSIEANRFEIGDAFCASNYHKVLDILDKMYKQNTDDILIANVFYRAFTDMWKAKLAINAGRTSADMARDFGFNPYAAGKIMKNARGLSLEFLETCVSLSKQLDIKLKSSPHNKRDLITMYIADVVSRRGKIAKA